MIDAIPCYAGAVPFFNLRNEGMSQAMRARGEIELLQLPGDMVHGLGAVRRDLHRFHGIQTPGTANALTAKTHVVKTTENERASALSFWLPQLSAIHSVIYLVSDAVS